MKVAYLVAILFLVATAGWYLRNGYRTAGKPATTVSLSTELYQPVINPADFVRTIDNKYHTLKPGTKFSYRELTPGGIEKIEISVSPESKTVLGIPVTVVRDTVWLNNIMKEDTIDLYAQDKAGTVWYFGETVNNYVDGKLTDHEGSWEAGIDGAKPGVAMEANPRVGDSYRQEYSEGVAEDMGDVISTDKKVVTPFGTFEGCLQTRDWSKIDSKLNEYKYYCPGVGFLTAGDSVEAPGTEKLELLEITRR